jgi:hypothetical protein
MGKISSKDTEVAKEARSRVSRGNKKDQPPLGRKTAKAAPTPLISTHGVLHTKLSFISCYMAKSLISAMPPVLPLVKRRQSLPRRYCSSLTTASLLVVALPKKVS